MGGGGSKGQPPGLKDDDAPTKAHAGAMDSSHEAKQAVLSDQNGALEDLVHEVSALMGESNDAVPGKDVQGAQGGNNTPNENANRNAPGVPVAHKKGFFRRMFGGQAAVDDSKEGGRAKTNEEVREQKRNGDARKQAAPVRADDNAPDKNDPLNLADHAHVPNRSGEEEEHDPLNTVHHASVTNRSIGKVEGESNTVTKAQEEEKVGFFGRLFGRRKRKVVPAEASGGMSNEHENIQVQGIDDELSYLEPVVEKNQDNEDLDSYLENEVIGIIDVVREEAIIKKEEDEDEILVFGKGETNKEERGEMTWEEFQAQARMKRDAEQAKLAPIERFRYDFQKRFQVFRSFQQQWCGFCDPLFIRVEKALGLDVEENAVRELPEYPAQNWWGGTLNNPWRKRFMTISDNPWLERFWLLNNFVHFSMLILDQQLKGTLKKYGLPFFVSFVPIGVYQLELFIKVSGWGFRGGKKALFNSDILNKIQFFVAISSLGEIGIPLTNYTYSYSLRGFGLFRMFRWLMMLDAFASLNIYLLTLGKGATALSTVVGVIFLILIFFGILGMGIWRASFRRRCVWADTGEVKLPEQGCKRIQRSQDPIGVYNNCGPLQRCLDVSNPNYGFSSFDNMPSALITLFQTLSKTAVYDIMWISMDSEPFAVVFTVAYYVIFCILAGHVVVNVFVAVLANVFALFRARFYDLLQNILGTNKETWMSEKGEKGTGTQSPQTGTLTADALPTNDFTVVNPNISRLAEAASRIFRSGFYTFLVIVAIMCNCASLALIGSLGNIDTPIGGLSSEEIDRILGQVINRFGVFFLANFVAQVISDGSFGKHFSQGKHIYDFMCLVPTTLALVADDFGATPQTTSFLRSMGILRLLRGCEHYWLRPIWLMLIEITRSASLMMNLVILLMFFVVAYYGLGAKLLPQDQLDERTNFDRFFVGFVTLIQIMSGDRWAFVMYDGMSLGCQEEEVKYKWFVSYAFGCDPGKVFAYASFYMVFYFVGQYVFITLFLAIILQKFQVDNFMTLGGDHEEPILLTREAAYKVVAKYQRLPSEAVNHELVEKAFEEYADFPMSIHAVVSQKKLMHFVRSKEPKVSWKLAKALGLVYLRYLFRRIGNSGQKFLDCEAFSPGGRCYNLCQPWPGDKDWKKPTSKFSVEDFLSSRPKTNLKTGSSRNRQISTGSGSHPRTAGSAPRTSGSAPKTAVSDENKLAKVKWYRRKNVFLHLATSKTFATYVYASIIASSILLALETPAEQVIESDHPYLVAGPVPRDWVRTYGPLMFTSIFSVEAICKILAYGFWFPNSHKYQAYLKDGWNQADFFVLCMSILDLLGASSWVGSDGDGFTGIIKISRSLRPIMLLRFNREFKKVVLAFLGSAKPIFYALLFCGLIIVIFVTIGMAVYKGKFHFCNDESLDGLVGEGRRECSGNLVLNTHAIETWGAGDYSKNSLDKDLTYKIYKPRAWIKPSLNFDDFRSAFATLSVCVTRKWFSVLMAASDCTGVDLQPVALYNIEIAVMFFVGFMVSGSFFAASFFISFVVDGFYAAREEEQTVKIYYEWIQKMMVVHWPGEDVDPPDNVVSIVLRIVMDSAMFQTGSALCVLINGAFICLSHEGESKEFAEMIDIQNDVFYAFLCVEVGLAYIAQGPSIFLKSAYNKFDLFLVISTSVTVGLGDSGEEYRTLAQVIRSFRLARFIQYLLKNRLVENMFDTVVLSITGALPVIFVLAIAMMIFSVMGTLFFGTTKMGQRLGRQANFEYFQNSFHTLFLMLNGEEWHILMEDCSLQYPHCTPKFTAPDGRVLSYGDCGLSYAPLYFVAFKVICEYTILNLFVGMILSNFSYAADSANSRTIITENDIERFARIWVKLADNRKTGTIPMHCIYQLMYRIGAPLGMYGNKQNIGRFLCVREDVRRRVKHLDEAQLIFEDVQGKSVPYSLRLHKWLADQESKYFEEAILVWQSMQKKANAISRELKERDYSGHRLSTEVGLDDDLMGSDDDSDKENSDGEEQLKNVEVSGGKFGHRKFIEDSSEKEEFRSSQQDLPGQADFRDEIESRGKREKWTSCHMNLREKLRRNIVSIGGGVGDDDEVFGWVSGAKMGYGGAPKGKRNGKVKKVKKKMIVLDYDAESLAARRAQRKAEQMDQWIVEDREKQAFVTEVKNSSAPKQTRMMKLAGLFRRLSELFISKRSAVLTRRMQGYATFDDVFNALVYWNNKDDVVPMQIIEDRFDFDDAVITGVANELVEGLIMGAIFRFRRRQIRESLDILQKANSAKKAANRMMKFKILKKEERDAASASALIKREIKEAIRPPTPAVNAATIVLHNEGALTDRGKLATLIVNCNINYRMLAEEAASWGYKIGDDGLMGLDDRGIKMLLALPEVSARLDITGLSGDEIRLLKMAADMNGIDLTDVGDMAELALKDIMTILDDPSVKAKLNDIKKEEEERRKAEELEAEKIANGKKTPAEVAELRRVKKQQERIEKLNTQIAAEKAELQRQLEETKKHAEDLTKQYQHARREGAHFAREVDRLAHEKATLEKVAEKLAATLPEQLNMTSMQISAEKAHQLQSEHNVADADASANALSLEDEDDLPPAERTKKLEGKIQIQKAMLKKLEEELTRFQNGDALAGKRQPSSWAYRGDVDAMKAARTRKILEAKEKRDERLGMNKFLEAAGVMAALGVEIPKSKEGDGGLRGAATIKKQPSWI